MHRYWQSAVRYDAHVGARETERTVIKFINFYVMNCTPYITLDSVNNYICDGNYCPVESFLSVLYMLYEDNNYGNNYTQNWTLCIDYRTSRVCARDFARVRENIKEKCFRKGTYALLRALIFSNVLEKVLTLFCWPLIFSILLSCCAVHFVRAIFLMTILNFINNCNFLI